MASKDYDAGKAFKRIEDELIRSMMRNLGRHLKEEDAEGFDWSQWQVEQLKYLEEYRRKNQDKYGPRFDEINGMIREAIWKSNDAGQKREELRILKKIAGNEELRRKYANRDASIEARGDAFFRINDRKMEALVNATTNDMQRAERAVLRRTNDQYRKIIFDAQMYASSGAATPAKAVDMATKDFLSRGIDSIQYKNGSRHTISDYADMAVKTAERRAYLAGEGKKRQEWGEHLVIVNKRADDPCPHCMKWIGKILIDDVYSGGKPDGKHKLLSKAMEEGFLHPRCKDGFTTYFPGITSVPDPATKEEIQAAVEKEKAENELNRAEQYEQKYERKAEYQLDPENRRESEAKEKMWKSEVERLSEQREKQEYITKTNNNHHGKEQLYLRNNIPSGFIDTRTVGNPISEERLQDFINNAQSKGIRIGANPNSTGNFELYCGDPDVLNDVLEHLGESMTEMKRAGLLKQDDDIILVYDNVLGYNGDNSAVDVGAFAETRGKTIILNKFMFDDSSYLKKQYEEAVKSKLFTQGTDYRNIVDHEFGHVIDKKNKNLRKRVIEVLQQEANNDNITLDEYLLQNVSEYATAKRRNDLYCEVISELGAMAKGKNRAFALDIFRKAGVRI